MPEISHFHPGKTVYTGFAFFSLYGAGKSSVILPFISYPVQTFISSRYPSGDPVFCKILPVFWTDMQFLAY